MSSRIAAGLSISKVAIPASSPTDTSWRSTNIGALLLATSTRVVEIKLTVIHARGFEITEAQLGLFHAIDDNGTRLTALASRARLSKAAMVGLVDRAEAAGWVARTVDPVDQRAKRVGLTAAGLSLRAALDDGIAAAEYETLAEIGAAAVARLRNKLGSYAASDPAAVRLKAVATDRGAAPVAAAWAAANIGRAVGLASQRFVVDVAARVAAEGFDISPALLGVVRHLDLGGTRLTEIAARARITKQSMRELVIRAERLGFVVRLADAGDARARSITFTTRGRALLDAARRGVSAAEAAMAAIVGAEDFATIKRDLGRLAVAAVAAAA